MRKYLAKFIAKNSLGKSQKPDFRTVYDDSTLDESIVELSDDLKAIHNSFEMQVRNHLSGANLSGDYSILIQKGIRGIALCKTEGYTLEVLKAYLYQLKKLHTSIGYVQKLSVHTCKSGKETLSYYLKPSLKLQTTQPAEQLYGNITLDLEIQDSIPKQLKCMSTYYSDANYKTVRDAEEWLSVAFLDEQFNL